VGTSSRKRGYTALSRKVTIGILIATTLGLVAWDVYVAVNGVRGDTISEILLEFAQKHPVLPFAIGVLCGHTLWGQRLKL
jgi:hypothetical protein